MKAIILAAGVGSRFTKSMAAQEGKFVTSLPKCLVQIDHRRILDFSLDTAIDLGVNEIVIVVGHLSHLIIEAYGAAYKGIPLVYAYQKKPLGLIHALGCGRDALGDADFWLFLGDEILIDANHQAMQNYFYQADAAISCGVIPADDPERICKNYTVSFDSVSSQIREVVEKPVQPLTPYIGTGHCLFRNDVLDYIDQISTDPQTGKKELAGLIQHAIDMGDTVLCHQFEEAFYYVNLNTYEDYVALKSALSEALA